MESREKRRKKTRRAKQVRAGKAIVWAGRIVHVLGQSHKLLQMILQQPLEQGPGQFTLRRN